MVGVGGRFRSCLTCRAKRKGCDQQRPSCGQCRRAGLNCAGYQNTVTLVHYNRYGHGATRYLSTENVPVPEESSSSSATADMSLVHAGTEFGLVDTYWNLYFPGPDLSGLPAMEHNHFVTPLFELWNRYRDDPLVKAGTHALTSAAIGRTYDDQQMAHDALQAYHKILHEVNQSLERPERRNRDSVLAACKYLATFESQAGVGFNWERHTLGTQQLLLVRGPHRHVNGMAHVVFLDARLHITIVSLKRRERTPLADPEWQQIPWSRHPKDPKQQLLDIMIQVSVVLPEFDAITAAKGTSMDTAKRRRRFFQHCSDLHYQAESWLHRLKAGIGSHAFDAFRDGVWPNSPLQHFGLAFTMSLYWTFCIVLYGQIKLALRDIPVPHAAITPADIQTWCDPEPYALRVADSVGYFFRSDVGAFPPSMYTFPMGVALNYFAYTYQTGHPAYLKLVEVFKTGKVGILTGRFLRSLQDTADPSKDTMRTFDQKEDPSEGFEHQKVRARNWYEKGEQSISSR